MNQTKMDFRILRRLLSAAARSGLNTPTAMVLATADEKGRPSARVVLLKAVGPEGFVFYTNQKSRKARQLKVNRWAALCFFWDSLMRQVSVEGRVKPVTRQEADAYWATRPRESQLGAWASLQSEPLDSRRRLERRLKEVTARFAGKSVPRPPHWSGYRLIPDRIEFWKSRPARLHDRLLFERRGRRWRRTLLYP